MKLCPECGSVNPIGLGRCLVCDDPLPPEVETLIDGRYRTLKELGRGANGVVYAALDVALKRAPTCRICRSDRLQRREARFHVLKPELPCPTIVLPDMGAYWLRRGSRILQVHAEVAIFLVNPVANL